MLDLRKFCQETYEDTYEREFENLNEAFTKKSKIDISEKKLDEFKIAARKKAIGRTFVAALNLYTDVEPADIWKNIYISHIFNKSGENDLEKIQKIVSADQSWKKSSGHALESFIVDILNPLLLPKGISIHLQKDVSKLLKNNSIVNDPKDLKYISSRLNKDIFDLYLAINKGQEQYKIFGFVQSKSSVRDRVTRDREPSIDAMKNFFVSIAFILDGTFLKLPKFIEMVNGNSSEFEINGWHAAYVFTNDTQYNGDRIHVVNLDMRTLVKHLVEAANYWIENRQWINHAWRPSN